MNRHISLFKLPPHFLCRLSFFYQLAVGRQLQTLEQTQGFLYSIAFSRENLFTVPKLTWPYSNKTSFALNLILEGIAGSWSVWFVLTHSLYVFLSTSIFPVNLQFPISPSLWL